ncbi:MAG: hypothetical protein DWH79_01810 [Planctomycetota bacterium]|nr:MAG: hypothetical protein DWH79_01810 [Planctomycetota bacterium]
MASPATPIPDLSTARLWRRSFWVYHVCFWLCVGSVAWAFLRILQPQGSGAIFSAVNRTSVAILLSAVIHLIYTSPLLRHLPRALRIVALFTISGVGVLATMALIIDHAAPLYLPRIIATGIWCLGFIGLETIEDLSLSSARAARAEADVAAARALSREHELRHLQAQMNPHFLFNALNAVVAHKHDPEAIERVTQDLADYLRFALREARTLEPLSRELQALEKYLSVQQSRFGDGLSCMIRCDQASHGVAVPPMMLQPLLENAFVHGPKTGPSPLVVSVTAAVVDGWLEVEVANTGRWVPPDPSRSPSTGITTLRKRLELLVGPEATVSTRADDGWVRVQIRLPARDLGQSAEHPA